MKFKFMSLLPFIFSLLHSFIFLPQEIFAQVIKTPNTALINGNWFNGKNFETRTMYSVSGLLTFRKPSRIDTTINLIGAFLVPPFAEAHNHNIGTGVTEWDKKAIQNYFAAGVFYVKIQGNLPMDDNTKRSLGINKSNSIDVVLAQGNLTATGGHPICLVESLLLRGYYPGNTKESLKDFRYFTIDSEADLEKKWPLILKSKPDFIKILLSQSDEFEKLKDDTTVRYKGLDPRLIPIIVRQAHKKKFKVSAHIINSADFHNALIAGVDEIAHMPRLISGDPL